MLWWEIQSAGIFCVGLSQHFNVCACIHYFQGASTDLLEKASHLTAFCAWDSSPHLPVTPSLVPRPFPPPVFDRILYAKMEGEGLGERVTCVTSGRCEGRHKGGSA